MSNELFLGWEEGQTNVKAFVYQPDGTERDFGTSDNGIDVTEASPSPAPATKGAYFGDCAAIQAGDKVIYTQNGHYIGTQEYDNRTEYKLASDGLDDITDSELTSLPSTFVEKILWLFARFYNKNEMTNSKLTTYNSSGTALTEQDVTDDGTTQTVDKCASP